MTWIGRAVPRREDERILRGHTRYLDDIERPGMLHASFVRSPFARARIADVSAPHGVTTITAADLRSTSPLPVQAPPGVTHADAPHPLLASGEARYAGQPVALVVAGSRALAEDAAERVEIDYEPLDAVVDPRSAPEELLRFERTSGDVDGAFAAAAHVVRAQHAIPRVAAVPIEPRGIVAEPAGDGRLIVWASAQDVHRTRAALAHALRLDTAAIQVVLPDVGGAFGSKGTPAPEAAAVAAAALRLGRPIKWAEDRFENFMAAYQGRGVAADVELALDATGRMLAVRARILADMGAYLYANSAAPPHTTAMLMCGCYAIPAASVTVVGARTDKVPTGPCRGAGRPEAAAFLELTVDEAARRLGIDPLELRRRNLVRGFPHETPLGWTYDSGDYERCMDRAVELVAPARGDDAERLVGVGVALYVERAGGQWDEARVALEPDGTVTADSGAGPHGQGHETTFAQIVADALGVEPGAVTLRFGDSDGAGSFASRSTAMAGSALLIAGRRLRARCDALDGGRGLTPAELAAEADEPLDAEARFSSDLVFGSGAYAAAVEIERATGVLRVRRIAAVDDAGVIVNPLLAEGQVIGGTVHGLGASLTEEIVHDEDGQPLTASFLHYGLLTAAEVPEIRTAFVQTPSPHNPLGAKGVGEGGAIGTPAAIGNAVAAALGGRHVDPPYTPDKLWAAMR
jgi:aerobic carbon-monoxide dehydrogenase large subunit